jgi:hypothetical protein
VACLEGVGPGVQPVELDQHGLELRMAEIGGERPARQDHHPLEGRVRHELPDAFPPY